MIERGDTNANGAVDREAAITGRKARAVTRCALFPFGRLVVCLAKRGAKGRTERGIEIENGMTVNAYALVQRQSPGL